MRNLNSIETSIISGGVAPAAPSHTTEDVLADILNVGAIAAFVMSGAYVGAAIGHKYLICANPSYDYVPVAAGFLGALAGYEMFAATHK